MKKELHKYIIYTIAYTIGVALISYMAISQLVTGYYVFNSIFLITLIILFAIADIWSIKKIFKYRK